MRLYVRACLFTCGSPFVYVFMCNLHYAWMFVYKCGCICMGDCVVWMYMCPIKSGCVRMCGWVWMYYCTCCIPVCLNVNVRVGLCVCVCVDFCVCVSVCVCRPSKRIDIPVPLLCNLRRSCLKESKEGWRERGRVS